MARLYLDTAPIVYHVKTPDALHLAAAIEGGCTGFLTNDAQLARFAGLAVEVI